MASQPTTFPTSFVDPWKQLLRAHRHEQSRDLPDIHLDNPDALITTSAPQSLLVGTGLSIYRRALLPAVLSARHSVHLVTCYWAASPSLDALRGTLLQLADARSRSPEQLPPLKVNIGFSSRGLLQKLFHTSSRDGHLYPPSKWHVLDLPDETTLRRAGIELTVKSLFFTPLSVMHPKYVIVDGKRAFMPSCNLSWERWFEGCVEMEGDVVQTLLDFNARVWGFRDARTHLDSIGNTTGVSSHRMQTPDIGAGDHESASSHNALNDSSATQSVPLSVDHPVPTILLPSSHHRNPRFSFFPFLSQSNPPITPLNAALLTLFANAQRSISILTPNVTSWPAMEALLEALSRGVDVHIRTSRNMMLIEQLITAGTTTSRCLTKLIRKYEALVSQQSHDVEAQRVPVGKLTILYYRPMASRKDWDDEPVVSHFKMTLVDGEYLVLGSGNMDRASWWTSQELGVLFHVPGFESHELWDGVLEARMETVFQS